MLLFVCLLLLLFLKLRRCCCLLCVRYAMHEQAAGEAHLEDPDEDAWTLRTLTRAPGPDALFD